MSTDALGCKYTWCRMQHGLVKLREQLDRVLMNSAAQVMLQGAKTINLPRTCSDHHPVLLDLDTAASLPPANKPLRFEASWLSRKEFSRVFSMAWNLHSNHLLQAI
ncbi:hypothetical protein SLE2022_313700 [Rubroshorea leprosula]